MFDSSTSLFAGMDNAQLRASLIAAQQAYIDISTGAKGESYGYTQGDGSKSVTYTRTNLVQLSALIRTLQMQLGVISAGRRPARFRF